MFPNSTNDTAGRETLPRVLIAEDDVETQVFLRIALHEAPFAFDLASDGHHALALYQDACAQERPYALLVLDGAMPGLSGWAVAESVRAAGDRAATIVFLSADDSEMSIARASVAGARDYWVKPVAVMNIRARIENALAHL